MPMSKFFVVLFFLNFCVFSENEARSSDRKQKTNSSKVKTLEKGKTNEEVDEYIKLNRLMWRSSRYKKSVKIKGRNFEEKTVIASTISGYHVFEGDIILGPSESRSSRLIEGVSQEKSNRGPLHSIRRSGEEYLWPMGILIYDISPELQNDQRIIDAMAHWEQETSIKFLKRTTEAFYVMFQDGYPKGCNSWVGRGVDFPQYQPQAINLASGCSTGNTIHEIGHALGLWHEQSREDRDDYVDIIWENIEEGREDAFKQHIVDGDDVGPYDFASIMHYPSTAFSANSLPTIVPKISNYGVMGQRLGLSQGDVDAIQEIYNYEFTKRPVAEEVTNKESEAYLVKTKKQLKKIAKLYKDKGYEGSAKKKIDKIASRVLHFLRNPQKDGSYFWAKSKVKKGKEVIIDQKTNPYSKQVKVIKKFVANPSEKKLKKVIKLEIP